MSRTDHHSPAWVRALRAAQDGHRTEQWHAATCIDALDWAPPRVARWVTAREAAAHGWEISDRWERYAPAGRVLALIPSRSQPCDIDTREGRCSRWVEDRDRWGYFSPPSRAEIHSGFYGPERAAVRDSLREAIKDYRANGTEEDWEPDVDVPVRQTRASTWAGGWWD